MTREQQAEALRFDYAATFTTPNGEHVMDDLRRYSGYDACLFSPGQPDRTAYVLGARDMFLYILDKLKAPEEPPQEQTDSEPTVNQRE